MRTARLIAACCLPSLLMLACAPRWRLPLEAPDPPSSQPGAAAEAAADAALRARLSELPAITAAVAGPQAAWRSYALGWADLGTKKPASHATRFRIYSVTKAMTAVLAVRLAERGRVSLDAPLSSALPHLVGPARDVTLEQLLRHTAGVRHYHDGEWPRVSRTHCATPGEALAIFAADPLLAPPGEQYAYSSFGFVLAAAAIEAAAGQPFETLLEEEVLRPAGMRDTEAERGVSGAAATFYEPARLGGVRVAEPWDNSCRVGAGHLLSTADDLARFGRAFLDGTLVSEAARRRMLVPTVDASGKPLDSAMPWGLLDVDGRAVAFQSGGAPGGRAYLLLDPERGWAVGLVGNLEGESLAAEARALLAAFGG